MVCLLVFLSSQLRRNAIAAKRNCGVRVLAIAVPISSTYIYGVPVGVLVLAIAATRGEHGVREPALR